MHSLFEESDSLNRPFECFVFDTKKEKFPIRPHWHYFVEMIYMLKGTARMQDGEKQYIVKEGEFILFYPKAVHSIFAVNEKPLRYAVLKFDLNHLNKMPYYSPKLGSIFRSAEAKNMPTYFDAKTAGRMKLEKLFAGCIREANSKQYGYDLLIQAYLYELIMYLIREWKDSGFFFENEFLHENLSYDIDTITEYIDEHLREGLQVRDVAGKCGLSYSCFAKKFRISYGVSCKEYIEMMRIFMVEDFLLFTDFDLNYISQETGFADCSHMIRSFKKYRGITPKQFRMHNQQGKDILLEKKQEN